MATKIKSLIRCCEACHLRPCYRTIRKHQRAGALIAEQYQQRCATKPSYPGTKLTKWFFDDSKLPGVSKIKYADSSC